MKQHMNSTSFLYFFVLFLAFVKIAAGQGSITLFTGGIGSGSGTGRSLASGFDINKDNKIDVIIGLPTIANISLFYNLSKSNVSDFSIHVPSGNTSSKFGWQTVVGDCNGDGWLDLFVSAYAESRVYAFYGSSAGYLTTPNVTLSGPADSSFGYALALGDVNNDSYVDLLVGATNYTNPEIDEGAAFLFYGSSSGLNTTYDWMMEGNIAGIQFGYAMDLVDTQGDGFDDLIIGAPFFDNAPYTHSGAAYLYMGSATGPSLSNTTLFPAMNNSCFFGSTIAYVNDINADGYEDFGIGAWGESYPFGAIYVYGGNVSGPFFSSKILGPEMPQGNGYSFAGSGSWDNDPYGDMILGGKATAKGGFVILKGSVDGILPGALYVFYSNTSKTFADSVAAPGDVDGDGYPDFLAGDSGAEAVYLLYSNGAPILAPASVTPTPSRTPSVTRTPSRTPSITPTPSTTPSVTPTTSRTPSPSRTPSRTPSVSPTPTSSVTPTASVTPTLTPTPTPTRSVTPTPSITPTTSRTPSPTVTPSVSPSVSPSPSRTPSASSSASKSPSASSSPSRSSTPSSSPSRSPSSSASVTPSITPTPSVTPSVTRTPSVTPSQTPSSSVTPTSNPSASITPSMTPTPSVTPSATPSRTPSSTPSTSATPSVSPSTAASPSSSPSPLKESGRHGGSSSGPLIGGIVGGVAALALCGVITGVAIRRRRKSQEVKDVIPME